MQNLSTRLSLIYRQSLLGGLGALMGSAIHQSLVKASLHSSISETNPLLVNAFMGLIFGLSIALVPASIEGFRHYSLVQAIKRACIAATCGGLGAMIAAPCAEWLHASLGGGIVGRVVAWSLFGASIGTAEAINGGSQWWRAVFGGLLGGALGGFLLETYLDPSQQQSQFGVLAIFLVGFFIMTLLTVFVHLLSGAWLEGLEGSKVAGQVYQLGKFRAPAKAILGSAKAGSLLVWIPGAEARHASLSLTSTGTELKHLASAGHTLVNGNPVSRVVLREGDVIEIAGCRLRYRQASIMRFFLFLTPGESKSLVQTHS